MKRYQMLRPYRRFGSIGSFGNFEAFFLNVTQSPNKQLQRSVKRRRSAAARAPFHYARTSRITRQRAAAELQS